MFGESAAGKLGSSLAGMMFVFAAFKQFFPQIIHTYIERQLRHLVAYLWPEAQITFYEYIHRRYQYSKAYTAIESYLSTRPSTAYATHLKGDAADNKSTKSLVFSLEDDEQVVEEFEGARVRWTSRKIVPNTKAISYYPGAGEKRYYTLTFNTKHRELIMDKYLRHVMEEGETVQNRRRQRKLYTNNPSSEWEDYKRGLWSKIKFEHPATFDNLAMDPVKKEEIIQDLMTFSKARDYYKKIGKAWKRGYLLYGPPGTGKSTMIACIANLLAYDVYDIELTTVKNNTELRNLLINTEGKALIVLEDIDCSLPITGKRKKDGDEGSDDTDSDDEDENKKEGNTNNQKSKNDSKNKVTLSGLLNFIDGLWSPCGGERIIIFTTNHVDKLDPALIRAGRMDKHIEMSYCTFEAFKVLARNYLSIDSHPLFDSIKTLLEETRISPADVAEHLLPKSGNELPEKRLKTVIEVIEKAKKAQKLVADEEAKKKRKQKRGSWIWMGLKSVGGGSRRSRSGTGLP